MIIKINNNYLEQLYHKLDHYHVFINIVPDFIGKLKKEVFSSCGHATLYYLGGKNLPTCYKNVFIDIEMNINQLEIHQLSVQVPLD